MRDPVVIEEARATDAPAIAGIHLDARRQAMPWLRNAHTDKATRDYFGQVVTDRLGTWWVTRLEGDVAAFLCLDGEDLEHLYVAPRWQGLRLGSALLTQAKSLRLRLLLWTFQRNPRARAFYEARGFVSIEQTDGDNEENEPGRAIRVESAMTSPVLLGKLASLADLAAIPEEEVWLASQKSARTRRAYKQDVAHFMRTLGITTPYQLSQVDPPDSVGHFNAKRPLNGESRSERYVKRFELPPSD